VKYGFELSAVVDLTNAQAGTLTTASNRVQIVTGSGIQFAEQNATATSVGPFDGVFPFSWKAPADPTVGDVRIDIAGCAANGDGTAAGDYIYAQELIIPAANVPAGSTSTSYRFNNLGMFTSKTIGGDIVNAGYARIIVAGGTSAPAGVAIFGLNANNILVSEAGVPASPLLLTGRIYAEVNGPLDTGLAIANPGSQTATISFYFTKTDGTDAGAGSTTLAPGAQMAKFLDQAPFNSGSVFQGTFTFTSNVPIGVVALRGLTNERSEFLMTTLSVVNLSGPPPTSAVVLPHFADGGGFTTSVILINPGDSTLSGTIQFRDGTGKPGTSTSYTIPRRTSFKFATPGQGSSAQTGSVTVTPGGGTAAPAAFNVFSYRPAATTVSEAGIVPVTGNALRIYVAASGVLGEVGSIQSGIAIANPTGSAAVVNFELFQQNGLSTGLKSTQTIPAFGQAAEFLNQLFPSLVPPFEGLLRVTATAPSLAAIGLRGRYNERSEFLFTTTTPANESAPPSSAEFDFAHIVAGSGFTTQFVLFSGSSGQTGNGTLQFFAQDGTPLPLVLSQ